MARGFLGSDASDSEDDKVQSKVGKDFRVNQDFAKKFTYNKKREELHRLEDKLGKTSRKRKRNDDSGSASVGHSDSSSTESEDEDEDDTGELATEVLDSEIVATLNAIRSKDPRVYDEKSTFYESLQAGRGGTLAERKGKPMYLRDYHREKLLTSTNGGDKDQEMQPTSYNQGQENLKRAVIGEINAATLVSSMSSDEEDEDDGFLVKKQPVKKSSNPPPLRIDVEAADQDPEKFLSNFMAARAWVPPSDTQLHPFESDDEEEDRKAEEFEEAYNFRFEDPVKSNEKLRSHARDMAAKYSVRREEKNSRQKKRDLEKEIREAEKRQLKEEKARLRKLRIEEVEEKVRKIRRAAGLRIEDIQPDDWSRFVNDDWDDAKWEEEMQKRFGEVYYAGDDVLSDAQDTKDDNIVKKRKLKKPKWEDDIDIKDLVPDFDENEEAGFSLSEDDTQGPNKDLGVRKTSKKGRQDLRKEVKKERRTIEQLVDDQLDLHTALVNGPSKTKGFRYRDTSPTSFGLSTRDILLADDSQLNQYVGLKKLAAFRDTEKKRKDKKNLGKKARLRIWRKETFGNEEGVQESVLSPDPMVDMDVDEDERADRSEMAARVRTSGRKKRRRPKKEKADRGEPA